jgi:hypothetical protein
LDQFFQGRPNASPVDRHAGNSNEAGFFTLYVVIVTLSVALCAISGAVAWQYRSFRSAQLWFYASVAASAGGLLLPFQARSPTSLVAAAANGLIISAFWLFDAELDTRKNRLFNGQAC